MRWNDSFHIIGARDMQANNALVGVVEVSLQSDTELARIVNDCGSDGTYPWVAGMCVDAGWRQRGIGRTLLHAVESFISTTWKRSTIGLHVHTCNTEVVEFYQRCGYSEVGRDPDWMDKLPWHEHRLVMCKRLDHV